MPRTLFNLPSEYENEHIQKGKLQAMQLD